eukprot:TRINITY_DN3540_c0_g1_i8.p1 TRINITY_DN3540_c0_g1~~TRINITY_DN3540_c0_g1_i8.p1  ORF type:complete len:736 (-),score=172.12 TRINITY_DN3540_c0_g1_i8:28-2235(-)
MWPSVAVAMLAFFAADVLPQCVATSATAVAKAGDDGPVRKVVKLLTEMKAEVESEAQEDEQIHGKMLCWCETNDEEKTTAIESAKKRIAELSTFIEEGTSVAAQLANEIAGLKTSIEQNQDALRKSAAIREEENSGFQADESELKEGLEALTQAVEVLSKVQHTGDYSASAGEVAESLAQVRRVVARVGSLPGSVSVAGSFPAAMQKDLWDFFGTLPIDSSIDRSIVTGLSQQTPTGAAAGASSYTARSSSVFGLLSEMKSTFTKDLVAAQKAELMALVAYHRLRAAKKNEVFTAQQTVAERTTRLADTESSVAQGKEDLTLTRADLSADEQFLVDLKKRCAAAKDTYSVRMRTRTEEMGAISDAIAILSAEDARDLFSSTISLVQTDTTNSRSALGASSVRSRSAASLLSAVTMRDAQEGMQLATLAAKVQIDSFVKVKEAMDKMVGQLKAQQQVEYEKKESCQQNFQDNQRSLREQESVKKDLIAFIDGQESSLARLDQELVDSTAAVQAAHISLQAAGEQRKTENHEFQKMIADHRGTIAVLQKALARLDQFYAAVQIKAKSRAFLQIREHQQHRNARGLHLESRQLVDGEQPVAGKAYKHAGGAMGVLQILEKIIQDVQTSSQEALASESASQAAYEDLVGNTNAMVESAKRHISQTSAVRGNTEAKKRSAEGELMSTKRGLEDLSGVKDALHLSCDWLVLHFDTRQQARQEEIEAIRQAKAILSGADFGR